VVEGVRTAVIALSAIATLGGAAFGQTEPDPPVTECDRLAAHPSDPGRVAPGIEWGAMDGAAAVAACKAALEEHPGEARLQAALGRAYEKVEQYDRAMALNRLAAEKGSLAAYHNLGNLYRKGRGVPVDPAEAAHWYRLAAEQGHMGDQYFLGLLYESGQGVPADDAQAAHWLGLSAAQGWPPAMDALGLLYLEGRGVEQDTERARELFARAAKDGRASAMVTCSAAAKASPLIPSAPAASTGGPPNAAAPRGRTISATAIVTASGSRSTWSKPTSGTRAPRCRATRPPPGSCRRSSACSPRPSWLRPAPAPRSCRPRRTDRRGQPDAERRRHLAQAPG
jgi:hypothetical protein